MKRAARTGPFPAQKFWENERTKELTYRYIGEQQVFIYYRFVAIVSGSNQSIFAVVRVSSFATLRYTEMPPTALLFRFSPAAAGGGSKTSGIARMNW